MSEEDYDQIPYAPPPSEGTDDMSVKEESDLSAGKLQKYDQRAYVKDLRTRNKNYEDRINKLERRIEALQNSEIELARFQTKDGMLQALIIVCTATIVIGGLMTSNDSESIKYAGYCLAGLSVLFQTVISLYKIPTKVA